MDLNHAIASEIRRIRLEKDLSQEKLAGLADIDRTYMQSIEKGTRNISVAMLLKICKALEVDASEIIKTVSNGI